ncbi:MAG: hypothetical protein U9Q33_06580 [Campylobacterota bacterium]|nr:hypothetical protein [Campylobacterota bacterium]
MDVVNKIKVGAMVLMTILLLYILLDDNNEIKTQKTQIVQTQTIEKPKKSIEIVYKDNVETTAKKEDTKVVVEEEKALDNEYETTTFNSEQNETVIFKTRTNKSKYLINLKSDKKLSSEKPIAFSRFIPLKGTLVDGDSEYKFRLSVENRYSKHLDNILFLEVIELSANKLYRCDAMFLKDIDIDYSYNLNIEKSDEDIFCHIGSSQKLPPLVMEHLDYEKTKNGLPDVKNEFIEKMIAQRLKEREMSKQQ